MKNSNTPKKELTVQQKINRRSFISFGVFGLMGVAAYKGWNWLYNAPRETAGITAGARAPMRRALNQTELAFRRFFSNNHLVKTYPKSMAAKNVRHNSDVGVKDHFDIAAWKLQVTRSNGEVLQITIDQIKALPKTEIVYDFKCVEGWDQIQYWGGLKMIDFIEHFGLAQEATLAYMGLMTPNRQYQVGLDMPSALHPQTILAYEMNGKPIPGNHGAPLRLIIPVKYGIKNIKRIGSIAFSNNRPPDYWARQGYDYYSGL
ncbi:molybdopterin-dependent oxidoreductase [Mucilaginibacter psychrotolerans]|uniref:Molybdopterin-binding oxidoreductase n=1 Tax=Mucilaginibacter psychrotolerans TaxID=1524096 RepID=A0A4Y8SD36_9SPHI|nr:molybdopterin-dependent oxidoreductase [Mucilaginibacter psychrotolerans]TFF36535.1 molybdopterin-binding oxidoreductase [Mucilaginibacter psychrotolerans]